ncbi:hypothetical protein [Stieleria varia]|uniref:Uncharacterized protein n=1 Tax=Stieleria varia TaxID=2528005 RepID=A0A5C5ZWG6_9BACT|nr:hypothetical protein [Stieleria varia]TWT91500.1 hypothetical protein Pla52n_65910 [Stieleria varia]
MQAILEWLSTLEWSRLLPELLGKMLGFLAGFAASWFLLFRKRLNALQRLKSGDTDDVIFQMHRLCPIADEDALTLVFRNIAPKTTLESLYDNPAARDQMKVLADGTTLHDPILKTEGTLGFEVLNDAAGHIAGLMAITPFERRTWLFAMTCEDRQVVRKKCIRCFLILPEELQRFSDWQWCTTKVRVESPWHWFRVVALHRIACLWETQESEKTQRGESDMPLVNAQLRHDRVRKLSLGIFPDENPISSPHVVDWTAHASKLAELGLDLMTATAPSETPAAGHSRDAEVSATEET